MPFVTSSFLFLVVGPEATSSVLAPVHIYIYISAFLFLRLGALGPNAVAGFFSLFFLVRLPR